MNGFPSASQSLNNRAWNSRKRYLSLPPSLPLSLFPGPNFFPTPSCLWFRGSITILSPCLSHPSRLLCHFLNFNSHCLPSGQLQLPLIWSQLQSLSLFGFCPCCPHLLLPLRIEPILLNMVFKVLHNLPFMFLPILTAPSSGQIRPFIVPQTHHVQATSIPWLPLFPTWGAPHVPWFLHWK